MVNKHWRSQAARAQNKRAAIISRPTSQLGHIQLWGVWELLSFSNGVKQIKLGYNLFFAICSPCINYATAYRQSPCPTRPNTIFEKRTSHNQSRFEKGPVLCAIFCSSNNCKPVKNMHSKRSISPRQLWILILVPPQLK